MDSAKLENGGGLRLGDVTGAGTWMGISIGEHVKRVVGEKDWWQEFLELVADIPVFFWVILYGMHHFVTLLIWFPLTAGFFRVRKVCKLQGFFPALCRFEGPHWALSVAGVGVKGWFLCLGSLGLCFSLLKSEQRHPILTAQRSYLRKFTVVWVFVRYFLSGSLIDWILPIDLILGCIVSSIRASVEGLVVVNIALILSKVLGLPVPVFCVGIMSAKKHIRLRKSVEVDTFEGVALDGWLINVFGPCAVPSDIKATLDSILVVTTKDEEWSSVRVLAYAGDKLAYYLEGLEGYEQNLKVVEVQQRAGLFDDVVLRNAMKYHAKSWWAGHEEAMHGKAAATVLEALACLVLGNIANEKKQREVFIHYKSALKLAEKRLTEDERFEECQG